MNREDFPMLNKDIIYFDNSATSLKPKCVIDKITEYYENYSANAHRGDYDISFKVDSLYEETRENVKNFINAKYNEEIIFTSGTTESLNMIASGFFAPLIDEGDEILITTSEHASNVLPWFRLENEKGAIVKYIDLDENYHVTLQNVKNAITPRTKIISLAYITNVIGDVRPIKEICKLAQSLNIFTVIDAAQSAPHIKMDVQDLGCDFMAFSAHKMLGPTGVGVLYGKKELLNELNPINLGGGMNESFDNPKAIFLKDLPYRLEAGTPNIAGIIGFNEAIKYLNKIGMDKISQKELELKKVMYNQKKKFCENEGLSEVLRCFLEGNHNHWRGTMGEFSEELLAFADEWETDEPRIVPLAANRLARELHSMDESLKRSGIYIKYSKDKRNYSRVEIWLVEEGE